MQHLNLCHGEEDILESVSFAAMDNLAGLTGLTGLGFCCCWPRNFLHAQWPSSMPCLQKLSMTASICDLPPELLFYTALKEVNFHPFSPCKVPDWFSRMTQLDHFHLSASGLYEFPDCLLKLSQLKGLTVWSHALRLPAGFTSLASWPHLTSLCVLETRPVRYPNAVEAHPPLLELQRLLGRRSRILHV